MIKLVVVFAVFAVAAAKPGLSTHSVVESAVIGANIHSVPSAVSHQSHTQYHSKAVLTPIVAPVVKSYVAAPVLHAAPVAHTAPLLSHVHQTLPVISSVHAVPVVHGASVLHTTPLVHSVHAAPLLSLLH